MFVVLVTILRGWMVLKAAAVDDIIAAAAVRKNLLTAVMLLFLLCRPSSWFLDLSNRTTGVQRRFKNGFEEARYRWISLWIPVARKAG